MSEVSGDMPWILGALGAIAFFAVFEDKAFKHGARINTLSHAVYTIGSKWPLSLWIMGVFSGVLAAHFFWHWCPPGSVNTGSLLPLHYAEDSFRTDIFHCVTITTVPPTLECQP